MSRSALNNFMQPFRAAEVWSRAIPAIRRATERFRDKPPTPIGPVPRTRFNGRVTPHRVFEARRYDLADMRRMKQAVEGATVNDVVLAVVGGALRKYLSDKTELPNDSLIAMAPINVRTQDEKNTEGNRVAAMLASLCTHIDSPVDRLAAVRDSTHNSKLFTSAIGARLMTDYDRFVPPRSRRWRRVCTAARARRRSGAHRHSTVSSRTCRVRSSRCTCRVRGSIGCSAWDRSPMASG